MEEMRPPINGPETGGMRRGYIWSLLILVYLPPVYHSHTHTARKESRVYHQPRGLALQMQVQHMHQFLLRHRVPSLHQKPNRYKMWRQKLTTPLLLINNINNLLPLWVIVPVILLHPQSLAKSPSTASHLSCWRMLRRERHFDSVQRPCGSSPSSMMMNERLSSVVIRLNCLKSRLPSRYCILSSPHRVLSRRSRGLWGPSPQQPHRPLLSVYSQMLRLRRELKPSILFPHETLRLLPCRPTPIEPRQPVVVAV